MFLFVIHDKNERRLSLIFRYFKSVAMIMNKNKTDFVDITVYVLEHICNTAFYLI